MTKISDEELARLAEGYPPEDCAEAIDRMAKELQQLRRVMAAIREGEDTLRAHANRVDRSFPITVRRITDILDAFRAAESP